MLLWRLYQCSCALITYLNICGAEDARDQFISTENWKQRRTDIDKFVETLRPHEVHIFDERRNSAEQHEGYLEARTEHLFGHGEVRYEDGR
jgi:hypothetical protein